MLCRQLFRCNAMLSLKLGKFRAIEKLAIAIKWKKNQSVQLKEEYLEHNLDQLPHKWRKWYYSLALSKHWYWKMKFFGNQLTSCRLIMFLGILSFLIEIFAFGSPFESSYVQWSFAKKITNKAIWNVFSHPN